jgi:hypothetical protein
MPVAKNTTPRDGKPAVVVAMADAARDLARQKHRRADPAPAEPRCGSLPGKWEANNLGLPREDPCPVEPIGREGELFHVIDSARQFRSLAASDFSQAGIQDLFAATPNYPKWAWPRYGRAPAPKDGEAPKPPPIKSFEADGFKEAIFLACTRKGLFSPADKLRGRGAWLSRSSGTLLYHAGEEIWEHDGARFHARETGLFEGHLYPRLAPLPAPWTEPLRETDNPAGTLLETFRKWQFERPEVDPILLLGWIGVAFLGGALEWRPALLLVGDKGTGKSTLQDGLKALFGDALFHSADTTAAGIYQKMAHDARPVAVDELEAGADNRKVDAVVRLMRAASSGALASRGGADHHGVEFQMRSAFLFSAINNPLQSAQDLSRVAILRLRPLVIGAEQPAPIDTETCGRKILARLMSEWKRFQPTYEAFARALAAGGHDARGQRTYGTLLACAELMLGEQADELGVPMSEDGAYWTRALAAENLPEVEDAAQNWRACFTWLLTAQVQQWRNGARQTVGKLLEDYQVNTDGTFTVVHARNELALTGLGLFVAGEIAPVALGPILAVPNSHPLVARLFEGTQWAGSPGAGGPWKDALRQAPPDIVITDKAKNRVRIGGVQLRCSLIVLKHFHDAPER